MLYNWWFPVVSYKKMALVRSLDETLRGAGGFGSTGVATTVPRSDQRDRRDVNGTGESKRDWDHMGLPGNRKCIPQTSPNTPCLNSIPSI